MNRSMTDHWTFRVALLAGFCFMLGFSYRYHLPKLEAFLLIKVENLTQTHSPIRVWAQKLNFHLMPLGVVLEDVRIIGQPPIDRYLAPAHIRRVGARLAILPLLRGEFRLAELYIRDTDLSIFLRDELFKNGSAAPPKLDFDLLYSLPLDELTLENVNLQARIDPNHMAIRAENLNLTLENRFRSLYVDVEAPDLMVKPSGPMRPLELQLELRALAEAHEMQISAFKLKANEGFFIASGRLNGDLSMGHIENGAIDTRAKLNFSDLNIWERIFLTHPQLPAMGGRAEVDLGIEIRNSAPYKLEGQVKTDAFTLDRFVIGDINGRAAYDMKTLTTTGISIQNNSGKAEVKAGRIEFGPDSIFSADVHAEKVDLAKFLRNLGIKNVPVELPVTGDTSCRGEWVKKEILCKAKISSPRLFVHSGHTDKTAIVEAHNLRAEGTYKVDMKQVEYKADLLVGAVSHAKTDGVINYKTGFKINYDSNKAAFSDIKNLANLKFEGDLAVKGSTEGTSDWATINMKVDGRDLWLEDYPIGVLNADLKYKAGHLNFPRAEGQFQVSRYAGSLDVDLIHHQLKIDMKVPFIEIKDIQTMFQRKVTLPIEASGTGTATIQAHGPFSFRDLTYTLISDFYRGEIANESFDKLSFNVHAKDGLVKSDKIQLTKGAGHIDMKGQITRDGRIDSVIVARSLRLEQSENVSALGFDVQGLADTTLLLRGQLPKPHIELNGRFSRVVLGDQAAEDSIFKLSFRPDRLEGSGQFLGSKVFGDFIIPYDNEAPFLFRMKAKDWDFTTLFSLVSRTARQMDFATNLTADINLRASKGGFWASTGQVQIDEFKVRKGPLTMKNEKTMYLVAREGVINSNNFYVTSGDSYMKLDAVNLEKNKLNASLNGKMDISLLGLLTPFISDLRGNLALSVDLNGNLDAPKLSGSAYLDRGYAKFNDFLHPFSNIRADILFNNNQVLINSVRSELASGQLSGEGRLTFTKDAKTVEVKGNFADVKINVPDGFHSNGNGTVSIHGSQFPYVMDINYNVAGGEVVYELGQDASGSAQVTASAYLPRFLYQEAFHPFTFLIDVNVKNPILLNNSLAHAQIGGQVKASGTPDRLMLTGTLNPLPGGKIFFHDVPFDVQSAFVEYANNPPWAPRVYITATTRVTESTHDEQGATEHQYDVNLLVQGRGPNPQIILSSQPPLNQREIVSLLALGMTTAALDERKSSDLQAAQTSTAIGTAILQRAGSKRLKETLGVDVKVSSSQPTPDTASTPKVTFSKQWTPKFSASASSTLKANPTNDVKVEYKMNKNVSAVGSWEGKESVQENQNTTQNVFGLDLEYKVQFK